MTPAMLPFSTLIMALLNLISDWFLGRIKQEAEVVVRLHEILADRARAQVQLGQDLAANDAATDRALATASPPAALAPPPPPSPPAPAPAATEERPAP